MSIIDRRHVKSLNRWYNKKLSPLKKGKAHGFWSNKLAHLTEKRNRQIHDPDNKAAKLVINHCLENNISAIVFGGHKEQKQESNMGKRNNQK